MRNVGGHGDRPDPIPRVEADELDVSTPEAEEAMRAATALVLEVARPLARKVELYERTLGLAVIPVLIRRAMLARWRRGREDRR